MHFLLYKILKLLLSQTGEGTIESYVNHPINFKSDKNIAQILRGFTGIIGNLNFALLDIIIGGISFFKDRNSEVIYVNSEDVREEPHV